MPTDFDIKVCSSHAIYPLPGSLTGKRVLEVGDHILLQYLIGTGTVDVEITAKNIPTNPVRFRAVYNAKFQVEGTFVIGNDKYTFSACPLDSNGYEITALTEVSYYCAGIMTMKRGSEDSGGTWTGK